MNMKTVNVKRKNGAKTVIRAPRQHESEPLSRDEVRSLKKRKLNRRRKVVRFLGSLALLVLVAAIGVALSLTVFFKINTIEVVGNKVYKVNEVIEHCGVKTGDNLFRVNEETVVATLTSSLPYIASVDVQKHLPGTLTVVVTEDTAAVAFKVGKTYVLADNAGKVLETGAKKHPGSALVRGVTLAEATAGRPLKCETEEQQALLDAYLEALRESGLEKLTAVDLRKPTMIRLAYDRRIIILVGTSDDFVNKLKRAKLAIDSENERSTVTVGTLDVTKAPNSYFREKTDD